MQQILASDWSPGLQYKPLIGPEWPKNDWVLSLSAWVLQGPVSYLISEFLRLIITIVISVFQWQTESSIENFFLSQAWVSSGTQGDSEGYHHIIAKPRRLIMGLMSLFVPAREPESWLGETWVLSSIMWSAEWGWGLRLRLGPIRRRGCRGEDWTWLQGRRNSGRTIVSLVSQCSQDMFPWLSHNMIPWISTWLELGENNSHILICNKL